MNATRDKLAAACIDVLGAEGIAGMSARVIATRAGVNQALIFYHFGTVGDLVVAGCQQAVDDNVEFYRAQFATVTSLVELLDLGRRLHEREREAGNVTVMAQLMAGAQQDEMFGAAARYAMQRWTNEIETVVRRVLADSPLALVAEPVGLARAISAGFIGLELYEGIDPVGAQSALDALERFGALVEMVDELGPVARRALRAKLRRRSS